MKSRISNRSDDAVSDFETGCTALTWAVAEGSASRIAERSRIQARRARRRRRLVTAGASFAVTIALSAIWTNRRPAASAESLPSSSIVAAPATQVLPDGTVVELRGASEIVTDFGPDVRRVILKEGEAFFQVAHNRERPFVVVVKDVQVRAVGTAFTVEFNPAAIEVLVTEGRVQVERPSSAADVALSSSGEVVDAGSVITVPMTAEVGPAALVASQIKPVSSAEMNERLSWRVPRIEFSGTPLAEAMGWFNRYSRVQLVLNDPSLGSLQLSGVLRANSPDSLLRVLRNDFGIEAERQGDDKIVLRRR